MIGYIGTAIIILLNITMLILKKESRIITLISFAWLFVVFYGNNSNPDYNGYLWRYNAQTYNTSMEYGYRFISELAYNKGLDYKYVVLILMLIATPFLYLSCRKLNCNYHFVFVLYVIPFLALDIIQVRNFVMCAIYTLAIIELGEGQKIKFVFMMLFASLFHTLSLVYLPLVILGDRSQISKKALKILVGIVLLFCVLAAFNRSTILEPMQLISSYILGTSEKIGYISSDVNFGFLLFFTVVFFNIMFSKKLVDSYKLLDPIDNYNNTRYLKIAQKFYLVNLALTIYMPLLMLNVNFLRIFRNNTLLLILLLGTLDRSIRTIPRPREKYIDIKKLKCQKKYLFFILIGFTLTWFICNGTIQYVDEILRNNFIFGISD